ARVVQTVDIYDALTNTRPYKQACSRERALEILEEETARGWRDPEVTSRFVRLNRRVLEKIRAYSRPVAAVSVRRSLSNLQQLLAS
ncbi:MAG: hypothetical protein KGN36_10455, partial [Acidobacteriota bacterium]|nr:hypothetical protein [Acidobacteriota bacterium]